MNQVVTVPPAAPQVLGEVLLLDPAPLRPWSLWWPDPRHEEIRPRLDLKIFLSFAPVAFTPSSFQIGPQV